jgi:hypothetical protein
MELYHYKYIEEKDVVYKTWHFSKGNIYPNNYAGKGEAKIIRVEENDETFNGAICGFVDGWTKLPKPSFKSGSQDEIDWYNTSNEEDHHFIIMEHQACTEWFNEKLNEIILAKKDNRKLGHLK